MLYLPDTRYLSLFKLVEWLLPPKLLPWLYNKRGLSIHLLPQSKEKAQKIITERFFTKSLKLTNDKRLAHETAHYRSKERAIVIPHQVVVSVSWADVFLHELGHAIDYLLLGNGKLLSCRKDITSLLDTDNPINKYCAKKDKLSGRPLEQFATMFAAYFREPEKGYSGPSIADLNDDFIFWLKKVLDIFEEDSLDGRNK